MSVLIQDLYDRLLLYGGIITGFGICFVATKKAWQACRKLMCFIVNLKNIEEKVEQRADRVERLIQAQNRRLDEIGSLAKQSHHAIYNGGANGILQNTELSAAFSSATFESAPQPMFMCDSKGANVKVNLAYRELVQVWRDDDLYGEQWISVLDGDLKDAYLSEWERCSAIGSDFYGDTGIRNPRTNEYRGAWKIHAPAKKRADGNYLYVGTFTTALDTKATEIAKEKNWWIARKV